MSSFIYKPDRALSNSALIIWIWFAGLLSGTWIFFFGLPYWVMKLSSIHSVLLGEKRDLFFTILPFLLSAIAVSFRRPSWLFLICWIKATLISFTCGIVCLYYGQAGWIARWIVSFVDICSIPLLFYYWLRNLSPPRCNHRHDYVVIFLVLLVFLLLDYRFVSPFGVKIGII